MVNRMITYSLPSDEWFKSLYGHVNKVPTHLVKRLVRTDDHLGLVGMDPHELLGLGGPRVGYGPAKENHAMSPWTPCEQIRLLCAQGIHSGQLFLLTFSSEHPPGNEDHQVVLPVDIIAAHVHVISGVHGVLGGRGRRQAFC